MGQGRARQPLPYVGAVSEADLLQLYERKWRAAVRIAAQIVGPDAEDVVQSVSFYLWRRRDSLPFMTEASFIWIVKRKAVQLRHRAWRRYVLTMDPHDLDMVERFNARRKRPSETA